MIESVKPHLQVVRDKFVPHSIKYVNAIEFSLYVFSCLSSMLY